MDPDPQHETWMWWLVIEGGALCGIVVGIYKVVRWIKWTPEPERWPELTDEQKFALLDLTPEQPKTLTAEQRKGDDQWQTISCARIAGGRAPCMTRRRISRAWTAESRKAGPGTHPRTWRGRFRPGKAVLG